MSFRMLASQAAVALRFRSLPALSSRIAPFSRAYSADRKYLKSHEWVSVDGDVGTIGISEFAQNELGEVVYVELPEPGSQVEAGSTFGVVESVKAASDVYSPVSGTVVEANGELSSSPGHVNSGPFTEGWMLKVKLGKPEELGSLLDESAYKEHCESVAH